MEIKLKTHCVLCDVSILIDLLNGQKRWEATTDKRKAKPVRLLIKTRALLVEQGRPSFDATGRARLVYKL